MAKLANSFVSTLHQIPFLTPRIKAAPSSNHSATQILKITPLKKSNKKRESSNMSRSGAIRAWAVAITIGAVEALKDQGVARWNYPLRRLQQHAKKHIESYYHQAKRMAGPAVTRVSNVGKKRPEESMRKVLELSCWGPNSVRF